MCVKVIDLAEENEHTALLTAAVSRFYQQPAQAAVLQRKPISLKKARVSFYRGYTVVRKNVALLI